MSRHIVLVDPLGDVLFSGASLIAGESLIARERGHDSDDTLPETLATPISTPIAAAVAAIAAAPESSEVMTHPYRADLDRDGDDDGELDSERCPETMRSAGSGVFRAVDASEVRTRRRSVG